MPLFRTYKVLFISRIMKDKLSHKSKLSKSIGKKMTFLFPLTVAGLFASYSEKFRPFVAADAYPFSFSDNVI